MEYTFQKWNNQKARKPLEIKEKPRNTDVSRLLFLAERAGFAPEAYYLKTLCFQWFQNYDSIIDSIISRRLKLGMLNSFL